LLSRRTNIRPLAEIQASRHTPRQPEGNWRNGIILEAETDWRVVSVEVRAERDSRVRELRLAGLPVTGIMDETGLTYGQVQSSIFRQGLRGIGGAAKKGGWRAQAAQSRRRRSRETVPLHKTHLASAAKDEVVPLQSLQSG
jgi:hypothetical protein